MWDSEEKITAIVHGGCPDGLGAAFAILKAFPNAVIKEHRHNRPLPEVQTDKVIFADIVPPRGELIALINQHGQDNVRVYDRHTTTESDLKGLPNCV